MKNILLDRIKYNVGLLYSNRLQSENGRRENWLDMAKAFAIMLVVMGHRGFISGKTNTWLSSFHLPLFFIASGILMKMKNDKAKAIEDFIKRKAKSLLIPYFSFSFCAMILDFFFVPFGKERLIPDLKSHLIETFTFQGYSVLWFLPVTFLAEIILFLICKKLNDYLSAILSSCLAIAFYYGYQMISRLCNLEEAGFWMVNLIGILRVIVKAFIALAFMSYGLIILSLLNKLTYNDKNENNSPKPIKKKLSIMELVIGAGLFSINIIFTDFICLKDLNNLDLGYITVYLVLGTTASAGLFLICRNMINIPVFTFFGRNSLIILCTHLNCYVLYYGTIFYMHFYKHYNLPCIVNETVSSNIYTMFFTFMLEIPVILMINIFLPFMLGRGYKSK